ncbi:hypothetical protein AtDm6_2082 [Acetobacter tropicalis]|uniref:Uncharacterized protein n=1 Tax=Acetobacter tropicalis TaxID=104102 RepID=A0A094YNC4_9PROT|nr:hypothetical protein AtDm6_2082 [Acetobacter tropicalis]
MKYSFPTGFIWLVLGTDISVLGAEDLRFSVLEPDWRVEEEAGAAWAMMQATGISRTVRPIPQHCR